MQRLKIEFALPLLLLLATLVAQRAEAQTFIAGADFQTRFDNREYADNDFGEPQTLFSARLTPYIGVEWMGQNRLIFGADLLQNFGEKSNFLSSVKPVMYYQFRNKERSVKVNAGIFDRRELVGSYSRAFFSDSTTFYHNRLAGFSAHYLSPTREKTYAEFAIDWEGMYSVETREKFRILSAGRYSFDHLYMGYDFSMFHFASKVTDHTVSDNLLINPYLGVEFSAFFDFDIRLGYLLAPQRARQFNDGWRTPSGGELYFSMQKWGVRIDNTLYVGEGMAHYYWLYGGELYAGETFYGTTRGVYNRTFVGYSRSFFDRTLSVDAGMIFHADGTGLGTQQVVQISVSLEHLFDRSRRK